MDANTKAETNQPKKVELMKKHQKGKKRLSMEVENKYEENNKHRKVPPVSPSELPRLATLLVT